MPIRTDITAEVPPLPEGWAGSPDELLQWAFSNAIFSFDGEFPTGQVGGSRPTTDVGLWYGENGIESYRDGKYRPISDVPIGVVMPYAVISGSIPENYLLCDGRSLLRAEYAELFEAIGVGWGTPVGPTEFYLPDMRGRVAVGAGQGDYKAQGIIGRMRELVAGTYNGFEWITRIVGFATSAPTASMRDIVGGLDSATTKGKYVGCQQPATVMPWIIRHR
jgi:hypothetical protein